jgi:hypothetical protein
LLAKRPKGALILITIEKKVVIPEDRLLHLDLQIPENVPIGKANLQVTITPTMDKWPTWKDLKKFQGLLKDLPDFEGNAVEIQRKMRDE